VYAPDIVHDDRGHLRRDPPGKHCVRCALKRMLLHFIQDLWNAALPMMKQAPKGKSTQEKS